jgi:hypothetical protein
MNFHYTGICLATYFVVIFAYTAHTNVCNIVEVVYVRGEYMKNYTWMSSRKSATYTFFIQKITLNIISKNATRGKAVGVKFTYRKFVFIHRLKVFYDDSNANSAIKFWNILGWRIMGSELWKRSFYLLECIAASYWIAPCSVGICNIFELLRRYAYDRRHSL